MERSSQTNSIVLKSQIREIYATGGLKNTQHGVRFQLKLVYFFICRALQLQNNYYDFKISTEYSDAKKFDDLVFVFEEDGKFKYRCLQCKHKQDESKHVITLDQLIKDKKDDFYLPKYFESYKYIIKDPYFAFNELKDLIIITNIGFKSNDMLKKIDPLGSKTYTLKLDWKESLIFDEVYDDFLKTKLYKFKKSFEGRELVVNILRSKNSTEVIEVENFLECFRFAANYPNELQLSEMINEILSEHFQLKQIDFVSDHILRLMWDWLSDKTGTMLNKNDAKYLLDCADCLGCKYKLTGLTELYVNKLQTYNITFSDSSLDLDLFLKSDAQVLNIISPHDTILSALQILQTLLSKLKHVDSFVFLSVEAMKLNETTLLKSFKLDIENILVINFDRDEDKYYLIYNTIIDILNENRYEIKLSDILVQDRKTINSLIDCEFLISLIKNTTVSIGNQIQNLEEVNNYFIERYFTRLDTTCNYKHALNIKERIILLSAEAGMGKSIILTKIAEILKEKSPHLWITRVNLNNFSNELRNSNFSSTDDCISFLLKAECLKTNFEKQLYKSLFKVNNRIIVLLDGYDEISPIFNEQVQKLVKTLLNTEIAQIWLSTRPHLKKQLEESHKVIAYKLVPLTQNDQNTLLSNFWSFNIPTEIFNAERIKYFQQKLLKIITGVFFGNHNEFIQVPLQLTILSEAYIDDLIDFLSSGKEDLNLQDNLNMISLFERFVNRKFCIYSKEKAKHGNTVAASEDIEKLKNFFVYKHKIASVFELIDPYFLEKMISGEEENTYTKFLNDLENGRERTGIITGVTEHQTSVNKINFSHRTFSEYFLALWLADKIENKNKRNENVLEFMREHLFKYEYLGTRKFFDFLSILDEQTKLHTAIINNNFAQVQSILEQPSLENETKTCIVNKTDSYGRTVLHLAIMYKMSDVIDFLLNYEVDLNIKDTLFGWRAVHCAFHLSLWKIMEKLVSSGCYTDDLFDINSVKYLTMIRTVLRFDHDCLSTVVFNEILKPNSRLFKENVQQRDGIYVVSLNLAARYGQVSVVDYLLTFNMLIHNFNWSDAYDTYNNTVLHLAVRGGHLEIAKRFVELLKVENINKETPLLTSIRFDRNDICKYLIEQGSNIEHKNINGETPLHYATKFGNIELVKYLIENKAQKNSRDKFGYRPIHRAVSGGHLEIVQYLIEVGVDKEARLRQHKGNSPLHIAVKYGHKDIYLYFLSQGVEQTPNNLGRNLLHFAISGDQRTMAEYLITNKICELESLDKEKYSPLNLAAKLGHINILQYLVSLNANIESKNKFDETPLASAAIKGRLEVVKYLVEEGEADIETRNNLGQTPFHLAVIYRREKIMKYLIDKSDVNTKDYNLNTPLHVAAKNCDINIAELLIEAKANVLAQNNEGNTPLHMCFKYKNLINHDGKIEQFCNYLLKNGARDNIKNNNEEVPKDCLEDIDIIDMLSEPEMLIETEDEREWYGSLAQSIADNNNVKLYSPKFCM